MGVPPVVDLRETIYGLDSAIDWGRQHIRIGRAPKPPVLCFAISPRSAETPLQALCGRVGGKIRSEYAMVGDVINLAARLMGKGKGRIVCDEVTHDLVRIPLLVSVVRLTV